MSRACQSSVIGSCAKGYPKRTRVSLNAGDWPRGILFVFCCDNDRWGTPHCMIQQGEDSGSFLEAPSFLSIEVELKVVPLVWPVSIAVAFEFVKEVDVG